MDLSLKERHKLLGKFGATFLIIYHLILIIYTTSIYSTMFRYSMVEVISLAFFLVFAFNICTLWKLNKISFFSTIISIAIIIYNNTRGMIYQVKYIKKYSEEHYYYDYYPNLNLDIIFLILFYGLLIAFLLIFLIFIIKKREVFGVNFKSIVKSIIKSIIKVIKKVIKKIIDFMDMDDDSKE